MAVRQTCPNFERILWGQVVGLGRKAYSSSKRSITITKSSAAVVFTSKRDDMKNKDMIKKTEVETPARSTRIQAAYEILDFAYRTFSDELVKRRMKQFLSSKHYQHKFRLCEDDKTYHKKLGSDNKRFRVFNFPPTASKLVATDTEIHSALTLPDSRGPKPENTQEKDQGSRAAKKQLRFPPSPHSRSARAHHGLSSRASAGPELTLPCPAPRCYTRGPPAPRGEAPTAPAPRAAGPGLTRHVRVPAHSESTRAPARRK
ncbi:hypothetical protein Nmel_009776 [Mimus melanotis]